MVRYNIYIVKRYLKIISESYYGVILIVTKCEFGAMYCKPE
jgi:hypothetical protein